MLAFCAGRRAASSFNLLRGARFEEIHRSRGQIGNLRHFGFLWQTAVDWAFLRALRRSSVGDFCVAHPGSMEYLHRLVGVLARQKFPTHHRGRGAASQAGQLQTRVLARIWTHLQSFLLKASADS